MLRKRGHSSNRRAFTLVELVIVGALIALFSGLAIFGVQQQFRSNQRKAIIGETRQIASALDFAYNDVGFFPKLCFMDDSKDLLKLAGQRAFGNPGTQSYAFMSILSVSTVPQATHIEQNWLGPYFSASQARSGVSQGRGGSKAMRLPDFEAGNPPVGIPATTAENATFQWPVDPFNGPYMVYMLNVDRTDPANPTLYFASQDSTNVTLSSSGVTGNFINAVVSYGPNQLPGGGEFFRPTAGDIFNVNDTGPYGLRLFVGNPNDTSLSLTYLLEDQFTDERANAWSWEYGQNYGMNAASFALSDDQSTPIGITDPGSDDVVFSF
ncbi:type II secretion system GspH family protein [bacterium]|nr:type II secretion system GspH family protein [bacterium]